MTEILTPEVINRAVSDYLASGGTITRIERGKSSLDDPSCLMWSAWRPRGADPKRERVRAHIRDLHRQGMRGAEIAARLKVSRSVVSKAVQAAVAVDPTLPAPGAASPDEVRRRHLADLDIGSMTRVELRERLGGVSWATVVRDAEVLRERGVEITLPPRPRRAPRGALYARLLAEGLSLVQIANRYGATPGTVRMRLREAGYTGELS